jgi:phosphoglycolate phosphatase
VLKGKRISLLPFARVCLPREEKTIRTIALKKDVKVFTQWDTEKYFIGKAGDYIAAPENDPNDVYVINREIFSKTYTHFC